MDASPTVAVRASAERTATADTFVVSLAVDVLADDASDAATRLAVGFAEVETAVGPLAGPDLAVEYGPLSIRRETWLPSEVAEPVNRWRAVRGATVTGTDTSQVERVVSTAAGLADRVDGFGLTGPLWRVSDDHVVHAEVQADAVRAAAARAAHYAGAVGGRLGALVELGDTDLARPGPVFALAASTSDFRPGLETLDFSPAQVQVTATVQGRWRIDL